MKQHLPRLAALILLLGSPASLLAGPFKTNIIPGVAAPVDYTLEIPEGKAVSIVNFLCNSLSKLNVTKGDRTIYILSSTYPDDTPAANAKDIVIAGPATISVEVNAGMNALLSYKLFAN